MEFKNVSQWLGLSIFYPELGIKQLSIFYSVGCLLAQVFGDVLPVLWSV